MLSTTSRKEISYQSLCFLLLVACPALSFPLILWGIYKRYEGGFFLFALFISLISFLTAPVGDLYRHTLTYYSYIHLSYNGFWNTIDNDFLTQFISYLCAQNDIPHNYIRLVFLFVCSMLYFKLFDRIIQEGGFSYTNKDYFIRFIIFVLGINFIGIAVGVRYGFAMSFYIWGAYFLLCRKSIGKAMAFFIVAATIHFSFIYYVIVLTLLSLIRLSKNTSIIVIALCFILSNLVLNNMEAVFLSNDLEGASYLGDGEWGRDAGGARSLNALILSRLISATQIPYIIFLYKVYDSRKPFVRWLVAILIVTSITYPLFSLFGRVSALFGALSLLFILYIEGKQQRQVSPRFLKVLLASAAVYVVCSTYYYKGIIAASRYGEMFRPVPAILTQPYDKYWIFTNLDSEGNKK